MQRRNVCRRAIKIGAAPGASANWLVVPATDDRQQEESRIHAHHDSLGQPTVRYGEHVEKLERQIADLQVQAEKARLQEVADVVSRIREAINVYGLTPDDLFGPTRRRAAPSAKAAASAPKYKDPVSEKTWTGRGKRPGWFVAALESGATTDSLAI